MAKIDDPGVSTTKEGPAGRGKRALETAETTYAGKRRNPALYKPLYAKYRPPTTVDAEINRVDKPYVEAHRKSQRRRQSTGRTARR